MWNGYSGFSGRAHSDHRVFVNGSRKGQRVLFDHRNRAKSGGRKEPQTRMQPGSLHTLGKAGKSKDSPPGDSRKDVIFPF